MFVENKTYYHIHVLGKKCDSLWREGSQFEVGKDRNHFLDYYEDAKIGVHFNEGKTISLLEIYSWLDKFDAEARKSVEKEWMEQAAKAIKEMGKYIREVIFEEVRASEFPNRPSRKTCIWLTEKEHIKSWLKVVHSGKREVFEVSVTGNIHVANEKYLGWDTLSHKELRDDAKKYWIGEDNESASLKEILFEGNMTVLKRTAGFE